MKPLILLAVAVLPATVVAAGLPRVAPPGPGTSPPPAGSRVEEVYDRRLGDEPRAGMPSPRPPGPSVLYPTPGGAVTDTGLPLSGKAGVLRDPDGGVWNCTSAGCFSPGGTFLPMTKTPPPAPPRE